MSSAAPDARRAGCRPVTAEVSGWGRFPAARTDLYRPERMRSLETAVGCADTVLARGLGRSYGDACYNSAGATVLMERLDRFLAFDSETGTLDCEAGVSFAQILETFVPRGFFPPVTPGTKFVTLGGALACDVHGKNHHVDGSFSRHVLDFDLLAADGSVLRCSRTANPDLFRATAGGMGLTGIVTRVRLTLRRMETSYISVDYERAANLGDALERLAARDAEYRYSVAWIDCLAQGQSLGRSVLMRGNPAGADETRDANVREPLRGMSTPRLRVPFDAPASLLNRHSVRAFNGLYYRRYPADARGRIVHFEPFFYPLDGIGDWNRLYGRRGFVQYQFVVPADAAAAALEDALSLVSNAGAPSFLAVLKRFGNAEEAGLLSFPRPGYTLALDLPWRGRDTETLLRALDDVVVDAGGRVYFAKDARMRRELVGGMYPDLDEWRGIRDRIDPAGRFSSDLGRRLGLAE
ncbi:MAG TPA: FAD-binding oxidoreductase [Longimicrobiales bacterium]|nr:FAD-binding oxidoreductase [Longimicrobiales bacterium]